MRRLSAITRISMCLSFLAVGALLLADITGLIPHAGPIITRERQSLAESIAIHSSVLASQGNFDRLAAALRATEQRNEDIASIGVRNVSGRLLVDIGDHRAHWDRNQQQRSTEAQFIVPIYAGDRLWGHIEMSFVHAAAGGLWKSYDTYFLELLVFAGICCFGTFYLFLRRVLTHLDPSRVVPDRVRRALDSLTGGLLLIDDKERIVLANEAFAKTAGTTAEALLGRTAQELPWTKRDSEVAPEQFPWQRTLASNVTTEGETLGLQLDEQKRKILMVNSSPIVDDGGRQHGALASFDDVTLLESKKDELVKMVTALKDSQEEVRKQNEELRQLAMHDTLTGCLNRRAFFEYLEMQWSAAERYETPLSCLMLDIDHFKSINDNHGHATGDAVLAKVGTALKNVARDSDAIGRYGGEEFAALLPNTDLPSAVVFAERCRKAIAAIRIENVSVTVSVGVSAVGHGATKTEQLLDQADQCLYAAKHGGRNRVVRWDEMTPLNKANESPEPKQELPKRETTSIAAPTIPFSAVNALLSALAYRDTATAAHSTRVADLCAAMARGRLSAADAYVLEIGALLHDIGKIGVPDAILLKPSQLTAEEWEVMRSHERIGVEIIASSFANPSLTKIVQDHHRPFGGHVTTPGAPVGKKIPLGARILCIAGAYDSMTANNVYREALSQDAAFAELRRFAGSQFDPELVEDFITMIQDLNYPTKSETPQITRDAALSVGTQMERIAQAVDELDIDGLTHLAKRLHTTAAKQGFGSVSALAKKLDLQLSEDPDAVALLQTTHELMDITRSALRASVDGSAQLSQSEARANAPVPGPSA